MDAIDRAEARHLEPPEPARTTALVTGASSGLGAAFARRLAALGYDVVLVARNAERLKAMADELEHDFGAACEVLAADLADRSDVQRVARRLADQQRPVDLLVNNAGLALGKPFLANDVAEEEAMLHVLVTAVLVLSHAAAGAMQGRGRGAIINVSSMAGWLPRGSYSAHKAWVTTFSEALAGQTAGRGVAVLVVCPGYFRSEFHQRAQMDVRGIPGPAWISADEVVEDAMAALAKGKVVCVPSRRYAVAAGALRHLPQALRTPRGRRR